MILSGYNQSTNPPHTQFLDCCKGSQPNITKFREHDDRKEKVFDPTINASLRMDWMDFWSKTINLKEIGAIVHFLWNLLTNKLSPTAAFSPSLDFYFFFGFLFFLSFCLLFFLFLSFCLFFLWNLLTNNLSATIFASKYFVQLIFMMSSGELSLENRWSMKNNLEVW